MTVTASCRPPVRCHCRGVLALGEGLRGLNNELEDEIGAVGVEGAGSIACAEAAVAKYGNQLVACNGAADEPAGAQDACNSPHSCECRGQAYRPRRAGNRTPSRIWRQGQGRCRIAGKIRRRSPCRSSGRISTRQERWIRNGGSSTGQLGGPRKAPEGRDRAAHSAGRVRIDDGSF